MKLRLVGQRLDNCGRWKIDLVQRLNPVPQVGDGKDTLLAGQDQYRPAREIRRQTGKRIDELLAFQTRSSMERAVT